MRASYWLVAGVIVAVALVIAFWPAVSHRQSLSVPGQYPIDDHRAEWNAIQSVGLYRPRAMAGQDLLVPSGYQDSKMRCGGDRKSCTLPTVPLGPQLVLNMEV